MASLIPTYEREREKQSFKSDHLASHQSSLKNLLFNFLFSDLMLHLTPYFKIISTGGLFKTSPLLPLILHDRTSFEQGIKERERATIVGDCMILVIFGKENAKFTIIMQRETGFHGKKGLLSMYCTKLKKQGRKGGTTLKTTIKLLDNLNKGALQPERPVLANSRKEPLTSSTILKLASKRGSPSCSW